jgi:hypothetical protein
LVDISIVAQNLDKAYIKFDTKRAAQGIGALGILGRIRIESGSY